MYLYVLAGASYITIYLQLMSANTSCYLMYGCVCVIQLGPWLAVEIPDLVEKGLVKHKEQKQY